MDAAQFCPGCQQDIKKHSAANTKGNTQINFPLSQLKHINLKDEQMMEFMFLLDKTVIAGRVCKYPHRAG